MIPPPNFKDSSEHVLAFHSVCPSAISGCTYILQYIAPEIIRPGKAFGLLLNENRLPILILHFQPMNWGEVNSTTPTPTHRGSKGCWVCMWLAHELHDQKTIWNLALICHLPHWGRSPHRCWQLEFTLRNAVLQQTSWGQFKVTPKDYRTMIT